MTQEKLEELKEDLIKLRNECLQTDEFDANGGIILSYAIGWISFKLEGRIYRISF